MYIIMSEVHEHELINETWSQPQQPLPFVESIETPHSERTLYGFYADVPWVQQEKAVKALLDDYFDYYVVGFEKTKDSKIEHIHVVTRCEPCQYNAFIAFVKKKHNLKGRAAKGKRKQYGKIRDIRSEQQLITYSIKSGHYVYVGYNSEFILQCANASYEKLSFKNRFRKIVDILNAELKITGISDWKSRQFIVERAIELHYEEFGTVLSTGPLKKYLYAAKIISSGEIADEIGRFFIYCKILHSNT